MKTIIQASDGTVCLQDDGILTPADIRLKLDYVDKKILLAYAENNMRAKWAAKQLDIHWNVVYNRLDRIWDKTGLDPHNFYDLQKLVDMAKT